MGFGLLFGIWVLSCSLKLVSICLGLIGRKIYETFCFVMNLGKCFKRIGCFCIEKSVPFAEIWGTDDEIFFALDE